MVWLDCDIPVDSVLNEFMKNYSCLGILMDILKSRLWLYETIIEISDFQVLEPHNFKTRLSAKDFL